MDSTCSKWDGRKIPCKCILPKKTPRQIIHKAIKKHAGLSDFDDEWIKHEVDAILRALERNDFKIVR